MRPLNTVEQAYTLVNNFYPITPVCILRLTNGPSAGILRSALDSLQRSHPLLMSVIAEYKGSFRFERDKEEKPVPLEIIKRENQNHWQLIARQELNKGFKLDEGGLMKVVYLKPHPPTEDAEIIFAFHHAVVDAISLFYILDRLLELVGKEYKKDTLATAPFLPFTSSPILEKLLPEAYTRPRLLFKVLPFLFRQVKDEMKYRKELGRINDSKIPPSSENDLVVRDFSSEETLALVKWSRKSKISINSLILASMLHAVNRHSYSGKRRLMRIVQFSNLRPYLKPPVDKTAVGCFATMMRYTETLSPDENIAETAAMMDRQFLESSKREDKFLFAILSKMMVKKAIRDHDARLGAAALSYAGAINFKQNYGNIIVRDFHGIITNNCLGAELSGFGKICFGKLSLDLNFLTAETSREKAEILADEIKSSLLTMIQ